MNFLQLFYVSYLQMITVVTKKTLEPGKQHLEKQCAQFLDGVQQVGIHSSTKIHHPPCWPSIPTP